MRSLRCNYLGTSVQRAQVIWQLMIVYLDPIAVNALDLIADDAQVEVPRESKVSVVDQGQ